MSDTTAAASTAVAPAQEQQPLTAASQPTATTTIEVIADENKYDDPIKPMPTRWIVGACAVLFGFIVAMAVFAIEASVYDSGAAALKTGIFFIVFGAVLLLVGVYGLSQRDLHTYKVLYAFFLSLISLMGGCALLQSQVTSTIWDKGSVKAMWSIAWISVAAFVIFFMLLLHAAIKRIRDPPMSAYEMRARDAVRKLNAERKRLDELSKRLQSELTAEKETSAGLKSQLADTQQDLDDAERDLEAKERVFVEKEEECATLQAHCEDLQQLVDQMTQAERDLVEQMRAGIQDGRAGVVGENLLNDQWTKLTASGITSVDGVPIGRGMVSASNNDGAQGEDAANATAKKEQWPGGEEFDLPNAVPPSLTDQMGRMASEIVRIQHQNASAVTQNTQMEAEIKYLTDLHARDMQALEDAKSTIALLEESTHAEEFEVFKARLIESERENDELKDQVLNLTRDNTTISVQFENLAEEHVKCGPLIAELTARNKQLIWLSEKAADHTACNRQIAELKSAYQQLEDEKALAAKQVRGLSDHYEESVAENMRKDNAIAELTVKHNEAANKFNDVASQLVEIQNSDRGELSNRLRQCKQALAEAQLALREHEKCSEWQRENTDLKQQLILANKHMQAEKKELNRVKTNFNATISNLEEEIRRLESELGDYRGDSELRSRLIEDAKMKFVRMRPQIGCEFQNVPAHGVLITSVLPGKPTDLAGLQPGDIVEQVNGHDTLNNNDFKKEVKKFRPGDQVPFQIDRNGNIMTLVVEVGSAGMTREEILTVRRIASGLIHKSDLNEMS